MIQEVFMNAGLCPICHKENHCHMVSGEDPMTCWCTKVSFPEGLLLLVPEEARNLGCVCEDCLQKYKEQEAASFHDPEFKLDKIQ